MSDDLRRGRSTDLTFGHANDIFSYVRHYDGVNTRTSKEWAVVPFDDNSVAFSEKGDSGSVIVDGHGLIGSIHASGAGARPESLDINYATPISFLIECMQHYSLRNLNLNPVLSA